MLSKEILTLASYFLKQYSNHLCDHGGNKNDIDEETRKLLSDDTLNAVAFSNEMNPEQVMHYGFLVVSHVAEEIDRASLPVFGDMMGSDIGCQGPISAAIVGNARPKPPATEATSKENDNEQ